MISLQVQSLRRKRNLSPEQFAEKVGITPEILCKWENGEVYPEINDVIAICYAFNVSADYLLLGKAGKDTVAVSTYVLFLIDLFIIVSMPLLARLMQYLEFLTFHNCYSDSNIYLYESPLIFLLIFSIVVFFTILLYIIGPIIKRFLKVSNK